MIESVDLVVAALAAGATAGLTDTASTAVKDAYEGLKSLALRALRGDMPDGAERTDLLEERLAEPHEYEAELREALVAANVDTNAELVAAAQKVLELVDPDGMSAGKFRVEVRDSKGLQIGDHNTMTLNFEK